MDRVGGASFSINGSSCNLVLLVDAHSLGVIGESHVTPLPPATTRKASG